MGIYPVIECVIVIFGYEAAAVDAVISDQFVVTCVPFLGLSVPPVMFRFGVFFRDLGGCLVRNGAYFLGIFRFEL